MGLYQVIGAVLLIGLIWSVYAGKIWLHRVIDRVREPVVYWLSTGLWSIVILSVLVC